VCGKGLKGLSMAVHSTLVENISNTYKDGFIVLGKKTTVDLIK
jgi:hypothetical protein